MSSQRLPYLSETKLTLDKKSGHFKLLLGSEN